MIGESEPVRVRGLPVPQLEPATQPSGACFHTTTVDDRGRVGVRSPLRELGWAAGAELSFRLVDGVVVVSPTAGGYRIDARGYLRIPAALRHRCRLTPGGRVLLVAIRRRDLLEIHPTVAVEAMLECRRQGRR